MENSNSHMNSKSPSMLTLQQKIFKQKIKVGRHGKKASPRVDREDEENWQESFDDPTRRAADYSAEKNGSKKKSKKKQIL